MIYLPFFLLVIILGCGKVQAPEFRHVSGFKVRSLGLQQTIIGFKVTYFNPNNFGVTVKQTEADVYMDSVFLGKFSQDTSIAVSKNAEFSIPLSGKISLQTALNLNLQDLENRDILLRAEGTTRVGKGGIFINKPIHYEGRHRIDEIRF